MDGESDGEKVITTVVTTATMTMDDGSAGLDRDLFWGLHNKEMTRTCPELTTDKYEKGR